MSDPFIGQIQMVGYNFEPRGWALCNGQLLLIAQHSSLFAVLGTTYGGDGVTNFGLPDLRCRAPMHAGQGAGLRRRFPGEMGGAETAALTQAQLGTHTHDWQVTDELGDQQSPVGHALAKSKSGRGGFLLYNATVPGAPMAPETLTSSGADQPKAHGNIQPSQVVNFVIALEGEFPPHDKESVPV